jgi:ABC-type molybdate transport system substrate-binding protein
MTTVNKKGQKETFLLTNYAKKLFFTKHGYGISYSGMASANDVPIGYYMQQYIDQLDLNLSVEQVIISVANSLKQVVGDGVCILIAGGFYEKEEYICTNNTICPQKVTTHKTFSNNSILAVTFSGRLDIANKYYNSKNEKAPSLIIDYHSLTLDDAIQLLSYVNYSVANDLRFSQESQDVSGDCDILIITNDGHIWTNGYKNLSLCL